MPTQRIPLVGSLIGRNTNPDNFSSYDQKFINCYPEVISNAITGQASVKLVKRPGFAANGTFGAGYSGVGGGAVWTGVGLGMFPCVNGTNLRVYDSTTALFADTIANYRSGRVAHISETLISGVPTLTLVTQRSTTQHAHAWYAAQGATAWTEITDADFPPNQNGTVVGGISGTTLTTTVSSTGVNLPIGAYLQTGGGVSFTPCRIISVGTAVAGVGTYTVSVSQTVAAGTTIYCGKMMVSKMVHLDGCAYVMDIDGTIYESDVNSLSSWSAVSYINAQSQPDPGRGLERLKNYVYAFGSTTLQLFYNSGASSGARISPVAGAVFNIGLPVADTNSYPICKTIGDAVYFSGIDAQSGKVAVYASAGGAPVKISSSYVDKLVQESGGIYVLGGVTLHGMQHIVFSIGTSEHPTYCVDTRQWWTWKTADDKVIASIMKSGDVDACMYNAVDQAQTKYEHAPDSASFKDNATTLTMTVLTDKLDQGTARRKVFSSAELVCDKQSTSGNISISWSDDDYGSFSTARTIDPSTGSRRIQRLGSTKGTNNHKRAWKIEESVNRPFRGEALDLTFEVTNA